MPITEHASDQPLHLAQPEARLEAYRRAAAPTRPSVDERAVDEATPSVPTVPTPAPTAIGAPPRVAHHFGSRQQQTAAARVGMWVFLATEVLMFGGLFCLYGTFRYLWPEAFAYGHQFLDTGWGLINTVLMILSSFTMAIAVFCAQRNHLQPLMLFLSLTIICGVCFLGAKAIEYRHKVEAGLLWGKSFQPVTHGILSTPTAVARLAPLPAPAGATTATDAAAGDAAAGRRLYMATCMACHGAAGEGMPSVAPPLRGADFTKTSSQQELAALITYGRQPNDLNSVMGGLMPPRGGNPFLTEQEVNNIAAYVRSMSDPSGVGAAAETALTAADAEALIPRWSGTPPPQVDTGLAPQWRSDRRTSRLSYALPTRDNHIPEHASTFFSLYFLMTGLHGIHLVIGISIVGWLLWRAAHWHFSAQYSGPVELGGLYWHLVDLVWLFLFPLFYLVH